MGTLNWQDCYDRIQLGKMNPIFVTIFDLGREAERNLCGQEKFIQKELDPFIKKFFEYAVGPVQGVEGACEEMIDIMSKSQVMGPIAKKYSEAYK